MKNLNYFIYTLIHIITISSTVYAMQLKDHLFQHCKDRPYFILECKKCKHQIKKNNHDQIYHHENCNAEYTCIRNLECPLCDTVIYSKSSNFKTHLKKHEPIEACPFCSEPCFNDTTPVNNSINNNTQLTSTIKSDSLMALKLQLEEAKKIRQQKLRNNNNPVKPPIYIDLTNTEKDCTNSTEEDSDDDFLTATIPTGYNYPESLPVNNNTDNSLDREFLALPIPTGYDYPENHLVNNNVNSTRDDDFLTATILPGYDIDFFTITSENLDNNNIQSVGTDSLNTPYAQRNIQHKIVEEKNSKNPY